MNAKPEPGTINDSKTPEPGKCSYDSYAGKKRFDRWDDMGSYFRKGLFVLVSIFIVLSAFGLYFSVNSIIDTWIEYQYVPVVQAMYYIAVILLGLYIMKSYLLTH